MDDWKELIDDFLGEAYSLIENLEESLLNLEKNSADQTAIDTVFRVAHTIKGGAGAVGFNDVQQLTHHMEDVLDMVRTKKLALSQDGISLLLEVRDELETLLKGHEQGTPHSFDKTQELISRLSTMKTPNQPPVVTEQSKISQESTAYAIDALPIAARFNLTPELVKLFRDSTSMGEKISFIEIRFNENYEMKEIGPVEVLSVINDLADPIHLNPNIETIDAEYHNFLNVVIPTEETPEKIKYKLGLPDVVSKITVHPVDEKFVELLEVSLNGEDPIETSSPIIQPLKEPIAQPNNRPEQKPTAPPAVLNDRVEQKPPDPPAVLKEKAPEPSPPVKEKEEEKRNPTLRVESGRIDELLNLLGELVIIRSGLSQYEMDMEKAIQNIRLSLRNFLSSTGDLPLNDDLEQNKIRNEMLRAGVQSLTENMDTYVDYMQQLSRMSGTLQNRMMNLRMVPVQTVFSRFPRLIRDIAKQLQKKIELIIEGEETEIDKGMIDDLYDPLMHMIRNSLDHALELPAERALSGKNEVGIIKLRAFQEGDGIFIEVSDDGKGIDAQKIKNKAVEKGFLSPEQVKDMSDKEAVNLIFAAGFSTAEQVSNLSGRGVGMDVARRKIEELGGSIVVSTVLGRGTTVRIRLPLTLAIIQGLLLRIENIHFVIPVAFIEETVILNVKDICILDNYRALRFRGSLIPIISLSGVLYGNDVLNQKQYQDIEHGYLSNTNIDVPADPTDPLGTQKNKDYCIIIKYGERQVGVVVSSIIGEQDIVIKPLDTKLIKSPGLAAATIVGNGEIGFILDMPQIIRYSFSKNQRG